MGGHHDKGVELRMNVKKSEMNGDGLENAAVLMERVDRSATPADLVSQMQRMERLLTLMDRLLRVSQPPKLGKIGLRWWKLSGHDATRTPVLVTWTRLRSGGWKARPLKQVRRDRINREGASALCADETYVLAMAATALIREYMRVRSDLFEVTRRLNRVHDHAAHTLDDMEAKARAAHMIVTKKLLKAGYDVDDATMTLPDRYTLD